MSERLPTWSERIPTCEAQIEVTLPDGDVQMLRCGLRVIHESHHGTVFWPVEESEWQAQGL